MRPKSAKAARWRWEATFQVTRELLDVFPAAEWESLKNDFILETWLEAAQKMQP